MQPFGNVAEAGGASWLRQLAVLAALATAGWLLLQALPIPALRVLLQSHVPLWVPASAIVFWRWGWALTHWIRALVYRALRYPRLRRQAARAVAQRGHVPQVSVLIATYKERPEITRRVILSIVSELASLQGLRERPLLLVVTGCAEDDAAIRAALAEGALGLPPHARPELLLARGTSGKRDALAKGLEILVGFGMHPDGVFVMMDGDTELAPNALSRSLPLFRLAPDVSAVTTNEHARVLGGPRWFAEWIHLRHAQRHVQMCSVALSGRLLCLTGRFSLFRASALDSSFIDIVRADHVRHWLWGRYALLSGDDKSTWFRLVSQGRRMLYAPDATVVTHELIIGSSLLRAYHNLRRWSGNMMRNSERAIAIGPGKAGLFCWLCLLDQRVCIWTTLLGPTACMYMALHGRFDLVSAYLLWVLSSRLVRSSAAWIHGRRLSFYYAPVAVLFDWGGALVKIWVMTFPAKQFWHNRGGRELDSTDGRSRVRNQRLLAGGMLATVLTGYVLAVGELIGATTILRDLSFALVTASGAELAVVLLASMVAVWLVLTRVADTESWAGSGSS